MDCIFCKIINGEIPSNTLYRDEEVIAIMDINPSCDGHVLVIPTKHYEDITMVDDDILIKMKKVAINIANNMIGIVNEKGYSLSINYGDKQDIKHIHMHILPNINKKAKRNYIDIYNEYIKRTSK